MTDEEVAEYLARADRPAHCAIHPDRPRHGVLFTGPKPVELCVECLAVGIRLAETKSDA